MGITVVSIAVTPRLPNSAHAGETCYMGCAFTATVHNDGASPVPVRLIGESDDGRGHGATNWADLDVPGGETTISCRVEFGAHFAHPGHTRLAGTARLLVEFRQVAEETASADFYVGQRLGIATQEWPKMDEPEVRRLAKELAEKGEPWFGRYQAQQTRGRVVLTATGSHPSPGHAAWLQPGRITTVPPEYFLRHAPPRHEQPGNPTPFTVRATFEARERVPTVRVRDREGVHDVEVEQQAEGPHFTIGQGE